MTITIERWSVDDHGELSELAVKQLYRRKDVRISACSYPAGVSFPERTRACRVFVVSGSCRFVSSEGAEIDSPALVPGDVAALPGGAYELTVVGDRTVALVKVWELGPHRN